MSEIETLRKQAQDARRRLYEAEDAERDRANAALVGKCFRCSNCYSCPEGPEDRWWLYAKVVAAGDGCVTLFQFQTDKYGKFSIVPAETRYGMGEAWKPITPLQFSRAWAQLHEEMSAAADAAGL